MHVSHIHRFIDQELFFCFLIVINYMYFFFFFTKGNIKIFALVSVFHWLRNSLRHETKIIPC